MSEQIFNVNCGFFDAVDNDRLYTADQMNLPYKRFLGNGVFAAPDGSPSGDFRVVPYTGMQITVMAGEGLFADKWFISENDIDITVPANTGASSRIDSVIIQVDKRVSGRVGNIVYRTGGVTAPDINTLEDVVEYRVANIFVAVGVSSIAAGNITDLRGSDGCPWVKSLVYQPDNAARIDEFIRTVGAMDATKVVKDVLFSSNSPVTNGTNLELAHDITDYDYIQIRYTCYGKTGLVRLKQTDITTWEGDLQATGQCHWSEFKNIIDDSFTPSQHGGVEKVTFMIGKVNSTHLTWRANAWSWSGLASDNGMNLTSIDTSSCGIYSITGISYKDAGFSKDPELTDIRIGYDGTVYQTAGDAVREQIRALHDLIASLA